MGAVSSFFGNGAHRTCVSSARVRHGYERGTFRCHLASVARGAHRDPLPPCHGRILSLRGCGRWREEKELFRCASRSRPASATAGSTPSSASPCPPSSTEAPGSTCGISTRPLVLAGAAASKDDDGALASYRDVDGDGYADLVVRFPSKLLHLDEQSTHAVLGGRTTDGRFLRGRGPLATVDRARAERRLARASTLPRRSCLRCTCASTSSRRIPPTAWSSATAEPSPSRS